MFGAIGRRGQGRQVWRANNLVHAYCDAGSSHSRPPPAGESYRPTASSRQSGTFRWLDSSDSKSASRKPLIALSKAAVHAISTVSPDFRPILLRMQESDPP